MPTQVNINMQGSNIKWFLTIDHLKVATYRAYLLDSNNREIEKWIDQRTDDQLIDTFTLNISPENLIRVLLLIQAIIVDSAHQGDPYNGTDLTPKKRSNY